MSNDMKSRLIGVGKFDCQAEGPVNLGERETSPEQEREKDINGEDMGARKVPIESFFVVQKQSLATLRTLQRIGWQCNAAITIVIIRGTYVRE